MTVNPNQFPRSGEVFLDHAAILVEEFDQSGRVMERLGFTLTPFRAHTSKLRADEPYAPLGTGNRCAMLRSGMIEVLGPTTAPTHDTPMSAQLRKQLARYPGLHLIAFSGWHAAAHHAALLQDGLDPAPIANLRRMHMTPDGEKQISASIVRLDPKAWPEGRVQIVFPTMSPDAMWHPSLVGHANRADRLSEMLVVVEDPADRASQFARFARSNFRQAGNRCVVDTDRGSVHLIAKEDVARYLPGMSVPTLPFIAAVALGSSDMQATKALFAERKISHVEHHGTVQIAREESLGASLVFHDREDGRVFDHLDACC